MAVNYARRLLHEVSQQPLGVVFRRVTPRADGTPDSQQAWNHADGGWDSAFDAAKHVRPLDRPDAVGNPDDQCFAVPLDVAGDPGAYATVHTLKQDGTALSAIAVYNSAILATYSLYG